MIDKFKISKVLQIFIQAGVFFILFSPLIVHSQFFFPFIVPRNIFFRIATEAIFFGWLLLMQINPEFRPNYKKWNKLVWLVIAFFAINVISTIFGIGAYSSFWSNYERMAGLFHLAHLLMLFLVVISVFKNRKQWGLILSFSLFVSTLMSLLAFSQWLDVPFLLKSSGGSRLTGTAGNATFLAAYLIFNIFIALYFLAKTKWFSLKTFAISFLVFDIFLAVSGIFYAIWKNYDWGYFNFFKAPLLQEAFKAATNQPISPGKFLFTPEQAKASLVLLISFVILQIGIGLSWYFKNKAEVRQALIAVIALLELFIVFNTQTRGAIIGLFLGFGFLAIASVIFSQSKKVKQVGIVFILLSIVAPVVLFGAKDSFLVRSNPTLSRITSISLRDTTTESRLLTWKASWQGMTESPKSFLIGYGPENYYYAFNKNFPVAIFKDAGSRVWFDRAHNIIFDIGVTTGIIGLIIYLSILIYASILLYKRYTQSKSIRESFLLIGLLIAYFVQNFFVFDTINTEILFYLVLGLIVFLHSQNDTDSKTEEEAGEYQDINYLYFSGVIIVFIVFVALLNVKALRANHYIFQALTDGQLESGDSSTVIVDKADLAFEDFKLAISQAIPGRFEARQQLASYVDGLKNRQVNRIPDDRLITMINFAQSELEKSIAEEPKNVRHYIFLATFYNSTTGYNRSNPQKTINLAKKAIELSPTRPHIYYEMGQAYAFQGNYEEAVSAFQKAVDLAPTVIDGHLNVLTMHIIFKKFDEADKLLESIKSEYDWEPTIEHYKYFVNLYGRIDKYDKMIEYQEKIVELDPTFDNYAQLAAIYRYVDKAKAIASVQKAIDLTDDNNLKEEGLKFIDLINSGQL